MRTAHDARSRGSLLCVTGAGLGQRDRIVDAQCERVGDSARRIKLEVSLTETQGIDRVGQQPASIDI